MPCSGPRDWTTGRYGHEARETPAEGGVIPVHIPLSYHPHLFVNMNETAIRVADMCKAKLQKFSDIQSREFFSSRVFHFCANLIRFHLNDSVNLYHFFVFGIYSTGNIFMFETLFFFSGRHLLRVDNASDTTKNSGDSTVRVDPLDHFKKYRGGYNLTNKHYWSVSLSLSLTHAR